MLLNAYYIYTYTTIQHLFEDSAVLMNQKSMRYHVRHITPLVASNI